MAKAKKNSQKGLIVSVVVLALAVLTVCTLFMPLIKTAVIALGKETVAISAKGWDCITAAFNSEASLDFSEGANYLIGLKAAEEGGFIATMMIWTYLLTVVVAAATAVFAVLGLLGMRFKLVNTVLGAALVVLAILAFVFVLVCASKNTALTEALGKESGEKTSALIAAFLMFAGVVAGGLQAYKARS